MNLVLFQASEIGRPLPLSDVRAQHLLRILKLQSGDSFDAGIVNGPSGKGIIRTVEAQEITFDYRAENSPQPLPSLALIVGWPRPQTARDILREATTLGATELHFVHTEKSDRNYAAASLWSGDEWRRHTIAGAQQGFTTRVPEIQFGKTLAEALARFRASATKLALDNYEATSALAREPLASAIPVVLAIGPERGWTSSDRHQLRENGFRLVDLGRPILRTETAVIAALVLARAQLDSPPAGPG